MKYSRINDISLDKYQIIGFDLDGTLYDEKEFVKQAYHQVAIYFERVSNTIDKYDVYKWMIERWIEKGSSYPYIFSECIEKFQIRNATIEQCLFHYRNAYFRLLLDTKIKEMLKQLNMLEKKIFLVTDGNANLQKRKFYTLGLMEYFHFENVVFTGLLGSEHYKPDTTALKYIDCLKENNDNSVIYFGDRKVDEQFATNAGFDFAHVSNFYAFWGELV
ncbi:HAD family hydrolase [Ureibacillus suwonensis]|uniref:HAD family hydrolase n=1 Tax=Ureibacillus suwonensis TaxID=313007 RepID=A0ABW0R8X9_9BACL